MMLGAFGEEALLVEAVNPAVTEELIPETALARGA
jgi:hypothetical protein